MPLRVRPMTCKAAALHVAKNHRHSRGTTGGLFAAAVYDGGRLAGVAICAKPVARMLDDGLTVEITRVCTDGTRNACSKLYGALCRAAAAIGYEKAVTYTLADEPGDSLRAAGFAVAARLKARPTWNCAARSRVQVDLFGNETRPPGEKLRWERTLT